MPHTIRWVMAMVMESDLQPVHAGVVYSPGWSGWQFFPEETLFVGLTSDADAQTYIRSILVFSPPKFPPMAILLKAFLRLRIVRNEPADRQKHVCIRETPGDPYNPWSTERELEMPLLAEHHLSTEIGLDLDFDLTYLVSKWCEGAPNNGVVVNLGASAPVLVGFSGGGAAGPAPILRLIYAVASPREDVQTLSIAPDGSLDSMRFPCADLVVKNHGPGLAWVTPLYGLDHEDPIDPAGIPLGVLEPGAYMDIKPRLKARTLSVRINTALQETTVTVISVSV